MFNNDIHSLTMIHQNNNLLGRDFLMSDYERRAFEHFRETDRIRDLHMAWGVYPPRYEASFRNELERARHFYRLYLDSIDNAPLDDALSSAIKKLLKSLKRGLYRYYHLIQILKEQKRLQQRIKSLFLPVKIIPESLRPINIAV